MRVIIQFFYTLLVRVNFMNENLFGLKKIELIWC